MTKEPTFPGSLVEWFVVPRFENQDEATGLDDKSKRMFRLDAVLGKHPWKVGMATTRHEKEDGESFILASDGATAMKMHTPAGDMMLHYNARRECSLVEFSCEATSIAEAKGAFLRGLTPLIDHVS
jgi:hypothetical protein